MLKISELRFVVKTFSSFSPMDGLDDLETLSQAIVNAVSKGFSFPSDQIEVVPLRIESLDSYDEEGEPRVARQNGATLSIRIEAAKRNGYGETWLLAELQSVTVLKLIRGEVDSGELERWRGYLAEPDSIEVLTIIHPNAAAVRTV